MVNSNLVFDSIENFYLKIEESVYNTESSISDAIRLLFDNTTDVTIKSKLQTEQYVFGFLIKNGEVTPKFSTTYENGTVWSYPSYNDFNIEAYDYVLSRAKQVNNNYLKIRYYQIIWCSPIKQKNNQVAKNIVDSSIEIIKSIDTNNTDKEYWLWYELAINGWLIAGQIKYNVLS